MQEYKICTKTIFDTTTSEIQFDENGVCNFVGIFNDLAETTIWRDTDLRLAELKATIQNLKLKNDTKKYDCILGLSGGLDSSYLALLCKQYGLNPLCVHFDYGWNSDAAVNNIQKIIEKTKFDLHTIVIDWDNFKELQKAYFEAGVLALDVPADHMIVGALYRTAHKLKIYDILSGSNIANEAILPYDWTFNNLDYVNIQDINAKHGKAKLSSLPTISRERRYYYELQFKIYQYPLLDLIDYTKEGAVETLIAEFGFVPYGEKHHESVFTRWYQGYFLPKYFNIDKRIAHYSNQILNNELTREQALVNMQSQPYARSQQIEDTTYIAKKLGYSDLEFDSILNKPKKKHSDFKTTFEPSENRKFLIKRLPIKLYSMISRLSK